MIVSIQTTKSKHVERYLRHVTAEDTVAAARDAVTMMLKKPDDFVIGNKRRSPFAKAKKLAAVRGDESTNCDDVVGRALDDGEPTEL